jgi:hypothetical protein
VDVEHPLVGLELVGDDVGVRRDVFLFLLLLRLPLLCSERRRHGEKAGGEKEQELPYMDSIHQHGYLR